MEQSSVVVLATPAVVPGGTITGHVELSAAQITEGQVEVELWHDESDFATEVEVYADEEIGRAWSSVTVPVRPGTGPGDPIGFVLSVPIEAVPAFSSPGPSLYENQTRLGKDIDAFTRTWSVRIVDDPGSAQAIEIQGPPPDTEPRPVEPEVADLPRRVPHAAEPWVMVLLGIAVVIGTFVVVLSETIGAWAIAPGLLLGIAIAIGAAWPASIRAHAAAEALAEVTMPSRAVRPGQDLVVDIEVTSTEPLAARLIATQTGRHYVHTQSQNSGNPEMQGKAKKMRWLEDAILATPPQPLAPGPQRLHLALPNHALPTYTGQRSSITWRLAVGKADDPMMEAPSIGLAAGEQLELFYAALAGDNLDCIVREFFVEPAPGPASAPSTDG